MRRRTRIAMAMRHILRLGKRTSIGVLLTEESGMETVTLIMPLDASICALMALTAAVEWKWSKVGSGNREKRYLQPRVRISLRLHPS